MTAVLSDEGGTAVRVEAGHRFFRNLRDMDAAVGASGCVMLQKSFVPQWAWVVHLKFANSEGQSGYRIATYHLYDRT